MASAFYPPSAKLRNFVAHYLIAEELQLNEGGNEMTMFPHGLIMLGFSYGHTTPTILDNGDSNILSRACVSGRYFHPYRMKFVDNRVLVITFRPFGFYHLFGQLPGTLNNQTINLETLGINDSENILDKLSKAVSHPDKISVVENWLLEKICNNKLGSSGLTEYILSEIIRDLGTVPIKKTLSRLHVSPRYAERHFKDYFGIGAKEFAKIIRFNLMANYLIDHPDAMGIELAGAGNFYDSSHLIKQFEKYSGATPNQFRNEMSGAWWYQTAALKQINMLNMVG